MGFFDGLNCGNILSAASDIFGSKGVGSLGMPPRSDYKRPIEPVEKKDNTTMFMIGGGALLVVMMFMFMKK